jgi:hypothetical protein
MSSFPYHTPPILAPGRIVQGNVPFFDHFTTAGYTKDLALANESDPGSKFSQVADCGEWLVTVIDGGTDNGEVIKIADGSEIAFTGGWLYLKNNDADNDAIEIQLNGERCKVSETSLIRFEARILLDDVSEIDWMVGMCTTDTDVLGGCNDGVYFRCPDSTGDIDAVVEDDTTEVVTDTGEDVADDTPVVLTIEIDGCGSTGTARFYVDGTLVRTQRGGLPDSGTWLTETWAQRNDGAVAQIAGIDYIYAHQVRD